MKFKQSAFLTSCRPFLPAATIIHAISPVAIAVELTWDIAPGVVGPGDGEITGGAGNWDTTSVSV